MPTPGPGDRMDPRLVAEFNRLFEIQYDRVRDFLILHYRANSRFGEPLWDHVRTMPIPDSLAAKMELFEARAALPDYKYGLFSRDSWLSVLEGQGLTPRANDRLAQSLPLEDLEARLADLKTRIDSNVATMTSHADFLARYAPGDLAAAVLTSAVA
jgi:tryptophan halogenase